MSDIPEVLAHIDGAAGVLSLNRPRAIHALTQDMVRAMTQSLLDWRDEDIDVVLIDHAVDPAGDPKLSRGFCSGGDIGLLRHSALHDGGAAGRAFFYDEYRLNHLLFTYEASMGGKPVVSFMDGITMGGGVGISQPARLRVATQNTRFAMPESGIGLFPDVGGGWYLSRLAGRLGQYLALTGARLDGAEALWCGLATHYLAAETLPEVKARLTAGEDPAQVLASAAQVPPPARLAAHAADIARLFASDRLEDILAALEADGSAFAQETLATIGTKSPTSCKIALRQLATSFTLPDFAANMAMEYRIGSRVLLLPDFAEGVRAVIVDKDNAPHWSPATPEEVTETMIAGVFAPLATSEEWTTL